MAEEKWTDAETALKPNGGETIPSFEPAKMARLNQRNMEFMSRATRACFACATGINREMFDFLNRRMKKDFDAASAFMRSRNGDDALSAHAEFFEEAFRDYADETSRLFDIAAKAARETLRPLDH